MGNWNILVNLGGYPQVVASALAELGDQLIGAEYEAIAYLGSQVVNGTNHAVLAKQTVLTGRDTENIVVLVFNEKPGEMKATLVSVDRVLESGLPMGGTHVDVQTDIPDEAQKAWDAAFDGFIGSTVTPFVYLGNQMVRGMVHYFVATVAPVVPDPVVTVQLVAVNAMDHTVSFVDVLGNKGEAALGYAFNWLKG